MAVLAAVSAVVTGTSAAAGASGTSPAAYGQAITSAVTSAATGTERFPGNDGAAHRVTWDGHSFKVDGQRLSIFSGELHYWREPSPEHWRDLLQKIRAAGFNAVSFYFFWGYHSSAPGKYDFSGVRDIDRLLAMAAEEGLYVIARPGPYINAEVSMGGLPAYLTNHPEGLRTTQPENLAASKEWLHAFNEIAKRHQVTDGGGSVLMYQVENELLNESPARAAFEAELVKQVKADGITVPLFHNDYNLNKQFIPKASGGTGPGADIGLDFYAYDDYPLGFNCNAARNQMRDREEAFRATIKNNPIFISEAQGGAFTPWGAAFTPEKCAQFVDPAFTRQWGVNNIGSGVTAFNYYMAFGGTNWGWTGSPSSGFTSYDYGAAISENRSVTRKLTEQKHIAYQLGALPDIAAMQRVVPPAVLSDGATVTALSRQSTERLTEGSVSGNGSRYIGFRLADSNATTDTTFTTALTLDKGVPVAAKEFTTDDADTTAITYTGAWTHATGQPWTANDYKGTESFSDTVGDSVSYTFTGPAIQVVMPQSENHGYGDVYIDGVKVGQTNSYRSSQNQTKQWVAFERTDLGAGEHTIRIVVTGQKEAASTGTFVSVDAFNVPSTSGPGTGTGTPAAAVVFPRVPQKLGTALHLHGRDALGITADARLGEHELYYTTSEVMGLTPTHGRDVLLLSGHEGDPGETVLHYASEPRVAVDGAEVQSTWDATTGALRLNYTHGPAASITVTGGGRPSLEVVPVERGAMDTTWRVSGALGESNATTLVRGADLVRTVRYADGVAHLTGSMSRAGSLTVDLPTGITSATFNGAALGDARTTDGRLTGTVPGPAPVALPALSWVRASENPESDPGHDDSDWTPASRTTTLNPRQGPGNQGVVLDSNAYAAYEGDVWYRAKYTAASDLTSISLRGNGSTGSPAGGAFGNQLTLVGGTAAHMLVWVNGRYVGARPANGSDQAFTVPAGVAEAGEPVVVATLVRNLGQNLDWSDNGLSRQNRGLHSATLGNTGAVTWRLQGALGAGEPVDAARGLYNNGGLYGERAGWHLPGYPTDGWQEAGDLHAPTAGVTWFRSGFDLDVPAGQDAALTLTVDSARFAGKTDRSRLVLFVNGWNIGIYAGNVGPQTVFTIPSGFLDMTGRNEVAVAMTAEEAGAGPEAIRLGLAGNVTGGVPAVQNAAPRSLALTLTSTTADETVTTRQDATLSGTVTVPALAAGTRTKVVVTWGDGATSTVTPVDGAWTAAHRYADGGDRTATVTLVDAVGGARLATATTEFVVAGATIEARLARNPVREGQFATVDTTVTGPDGGPLPGVVSVTEGGRSLAAGTLDAKGQVSLRLPRTLRAGEHDLVVTYGGSASYGPAATTLSLRVTQ